MNKLTLKHSLMKSKKPQVLGLFCFVTSLLLTDVIWAQEAADNTFNLGLNTLSRGELRYGGFQESDPTVEGLSNFVLGRYRLTAEYMHGSWLETKLSIQQSGVWGQAQSNINLYEGWALLKSKNGLFAKFGRQELAYDDERILGPDDWTMAAYTHDMLKLGYEGNLHKVHLMLAYNQNPSNMNGQTYYTGGNQPYKTMQNLWYHYDAPTFPLGVSLLFMNIGMQNEDQDHPKTYFQQLAGTYLSFMPKSWSVEGAFYYQMGTEEHALPLRAYMGSVKIDVHPHENYSIFTGYDYLSGDKYFAIPPNGAIGLTYHNVIRGFNPIYGSHHEFYGAMDFYYVSTYVDGFTPGLQNLYLGGSYKPIENLNLTTNLHYLAITSDLPLVKKTLGYEIEFTATYDPNDFISLECGYSFMKGTKTMMTLKRVSDDQQLHWVYLMVVFSPRLFYTSWQDKVENK